MEVSKRLKEARARIGYTLLQACEKSCIEPDLLYGFEDGTQEPKFYHLAALARVYKVTTEDLMGDNPIKREQCLWCKDIP